MVNRPVFNALQRQGKEHLIETVGEGLRGTMIRSRAEAPPPACAPPTAAAQRRRRPRPRRLPRPRRGAAARGRAAYHGRAEAPPPPPSGE